LIAIWPNNLDRQNTIDEKAWLQVRHWPWKELEREREIRLKAK